MYDSDTINGIYKKRLSQIIVYHYDVTGHVVFFSFRDCVIYLGFFVIRLRKENEGKG